VPSGQAARSSGRSGSEAGSCVVRGVGRNLTKSLTRGMGFRLRMSGMLSIMISPPPGLQEETRVSEEGETEAGRGPPLLPHLRLGFGGQDGRASPGWLGTHPSDPHPWGRDHQTKNGVGEGDSGRKLGFSPREDVLLQWCDSETQEKKHPFGLALALQRGAGGLGLPSGG